MAKPTKEDKYATHLAETIAYHVKMLSDRPRVEALRRAVEMYVREGTTVLDVGSGTGVWAILAAKLGASRVVAVEMEECLIPIIHKHAEENGVAGRIDIRHGNIDDLAINEKFDVIVGEFFGGNVFGEATTNSIVRLRKRFLADGGVIIPQWMKLFAAPMPAAPIQSTLPVTTGCLDGLSLNYGMMTPGHDELKLEFAAEPKLLKSIDYMSIDDVQAVAPVSAEWTMNDVSRVGSIVVFCESQYASGVGLNSITSTTWIIETYRFVPFDVEQGTLRFTAVFDPKGSSWSISLPSHPEIAVQSYAPVFGYMRSKMMLQATPFKKLRRVAKKD